MKKSILIILFLLLPAGLFSQSMAFRELYDKYAGVDGYVTLEMSGAMFKAINAEVNDHGEKGADFMKEIEQLVMIVAEKAVDAFELDVAQMISNGGYDLMTTIRDGGSKVEFFAIRKRGKASELVMIVADKSDYVVMSITGSDLDVNELSRMAYKSGKRTP